MAIKDHPETSDAGRKAKADAEKADDASKTADEVIGREVEQGFRGVEVDPTPNENYTMAGVVKGAPTPETDDSAAEKARKAAQDVSRKSTGVAGR